MDVCHIVSENPWKCFGISFANNLCIPEYSVWGWGCVCILAWGGGGVKGSYLESQTRCLHSWPCSFPTRSLHGYCNQVSLRPLPSAVSTVREWLCLPETKRRNRTCSSISDQCVHWRRGLIKILRQIQIKIHIQEFVFTLMLQDREGICWHFWLFLKNYDTDREREFPTYCIGMCILWWTINRYNLVLVQILT